MHLQISQTVNPDKQHPTLIRYNHRLGAADEKEEAGEMRTYDGHQITNMRTK